MGKPTGFIEFDRMDEDRRDPTARIGDWNEFLVQIEEIPKNSNGKIDRVLLSDEAFLLDKK